MRTTAFFFFFLLIFTSAFAQKIERVEPPFWWVDMQHPTVQIMVYGENIAELTPVINSQNIDLQQVIRVTNPNYLFLDLKIADAKAGNYAINFSKNDKVITTHNYELKAREKGAGERQGFTNSDVMYLITPDRFANGKPENDVVEGLKEQPDRSAKCGRHGGDIEGIRQNLDYLKDMGFTAIWLNPVLENDMTQVSYHGYSTTDFYQVDRRYGSNEEYQNLAQEARSKGIGLIMDMIVNHCGSEHWWMDDLPMEDWINQHPEYTGTNHRKTLLQDPYASKEDLRIFADGWFVPTMPDLNQRNPLMANYLTQNAIWWIEYLGLAGIRMDTYPYPDMDYMTEWTRRVMLEYPNFNVVGEEWNESPNIVAYWQRGKENPNGYVSHLTSVMDFPMQMAMSKALTEEEGWQEGFPRMYETLAHDFVYAAPNELVIFPDNHDMSRIFKQLNHDYPSYQMALTYILTMRGVPQLFYGTEILLADPNGDHCLIREDFPGGWAGDKVNGFTGEGLTDQQKSAQNWLKKLLNWRLNATAVHSGDLVHFIPYDGVYVYFRSEEKQRIMIILNKNKEIYTLDLARFAEQLEGVKSGIDVTSGAIFSLEKSVELKEQGALILELK